MKKNDYFISKNQKSLFNKINKIGINFKTGKETNNKVLSYKEQKEIKKTLLESIPKKSKSLDKVIKEFEKKILKNSINFGNPNFLAFPDCGNSSAALAGHILGGFMNQNLINSIRTSPTATFVEIVTIDWLREIAGFKIKNNKKSILDVGGISVTGGTSANTIGLLLAREEKIKNTLKKGISKKTAQKMKVFIPEGIGHYSISAGMGWIGLGTNNIINVKTTNEFKIDQKDLIEKIRNEKMKGNIPTCLIAYAGDSRTMAIDDFPSLSKIAKENKIWFHIDACHGYSLCFSKKLKNKVKGINLADSVTIDPHKVLFAPYSLSFILLKNPQKFNLISGVSDLITREKFSFGQITPFFGSRSFDSLKLWFLIKNMGKEKLGKLIEERHKMVKYFANLIKKSSNFCLLNNVEINSAVFIYIPQESLKQIKKKHDISLINKLNERIHGRMFKEGKFYLHTFKLNDFKNKMGLGTDITLQTLRLMLGNSLTTKKDLNNLIKYLEKISEEEWRKMKK